VRDGGWEADYENEYEKTRPWDEFKRRYTSDGIESSGRRYGRQEARNVRI
jgi:hypothetical protein